MTRLDGRTLWCRSLRDRTNNAIESCSYEYEAKGLEGKKVEPFNVTFTAAYERGLSDRATLLKLEE